MHLLKKLKNESDMDTKERRKLIAIANKCRSFLYLNDFLSDMENEKVHSRISKYQDKYKVSITNKQLDSIDIIYNDDIGKK